MLESSEDGYLFVTAAHLFEGVSLTRFNLEEDPVLYLAKPGKPSLRLNRRNVVLMKNFDVVFIKTPRLSDLELNPLPIGRLRKETRLRNIGYPYRAIRNQPILIDATAGSLSFEGGPWFQEGGVTKNLKLSLNSDDIHLIDRKVIFLDYPSEPGFSGGPLLDAETNRVVGMMLGVLPSMKYNQAVTSNVFAFSLYIEEVLAAL
ncbi:MAG: trypsin-like peptidase domain-containing protein, partial [Candidatus Omnitrophica bacterium]|nr:trypsin-like peptidase domain-containing protein [Candidatus Omnitrophota bacterium]